MCVCVGGGGGVRGSARERQIERGRQRQGETAAETERKREKDRQTKQIGMNGRDTERKNTHETARGECVFLSVRLPAFVSVYECRVFPQCGTEKHTRSSKTAHTIGTRS